MAQSRTLADTAAVTPATARPTLLEIALIFSAISATSFGGGQKASVRRQVVTAHRWMTDDQFMEGLEFAQVMPGPNILNLAVFCGQRARGVPGAIIAFLGVSIPAFVIVLISGALYFRFGSDPFVHGALLGCAAGALGLTVGNALELSAELREDWINFLLLAATAVAVTLFHAPLLAVLVVFGGIGIWRHRVAPARPK